MVNLELLSQPSVLQLARAGDFQAIAYWLNTYLVPQEIYARVAVDRPGWLLVLVEFCQPPDRERLNRFVCHRLCRLNSDVIQGVRIIARPLGAPDVWWDHSIRLSSEPKRITRPTRRVRTPHPSRQAIQSHPANPSGNRPRPPHKRRRSPATLALAHRPALATARNQSMHALTKSARALTASLVESTRQLSPTQVAILGKAAAALFLVGFGIEIVGHSLSSWGDPSARPMSVQTASGKVSVIQAAATDAAGPTVTLTFSSDPTVNLTSTGALTQELSTAENSNSTLPWSTSESSTGPGGAGNLEAPLLLGNVSDEAVNAIATPATSAEIASFATTAEMTPRPSDILMTNLDYPVSNPQFLLGPSLDTKPGSTLNTNHTGVMRSPAADSVTVVSLAGEPLMQAGSAGLVKTLDAIEKAGMHAVGAGRNRHEARRPEIIDVRGKRIAYLGYSDSEAHAAKRWQAGTNPALKDQVTEDIRAIRDQVDWVVVNYHWSQDLASFPADWQMTVARHAIDEGADLVVGYHPNVLQGAEIYKGRAIAYSLGDFVFQDGGQATNASALNASAVDASAVNSTSNSKPAATPVKPQYDTAMLKVSIKDDQMKLEFLPVQVKDGQPAIAQGQKQTEILRYLSQASALFETPLRSPTVLNRLTPAHKIDGSPGAASPKSSGTEPTALPIPAENKSAPATNNSSPTENGSGSFIDYPQSPANAPDAAPTPTSRNEVRPSSTPTSPPQATLPALTEKTGVTQSPAVPPSASLSNAPSEMPSTLTLAQSLLAKPTAKSATTGAGGAVVTAAKSEQATSEDTPFTKAGAKPGATTGKRTDKVTQPSPLVTVP